MRLGRQPMNAGERVDQQLLVLDLTESSDSSDDRCPIGDLEPASQDHRAFGRAARAAKADQLDAVSYYANFAARHDPPAPHIRRDVVCEAVEASRANCTASAEPPKTSSLGIGFMAVRGVNDAHAAQPERRPPRVEERADLMRVD